MPKGKVLQRGAVGGRPIDFDAKLEAELTDECIRDLFEDMSGKDIPLSKVKERSKEIRALLSHHVSFFKHKQVTEGQLKKGIKSIKLRSQRLLKALGKPSEGNWAKKLYKSIQDGGVDVWDNLHKAMRRLDHQEGLFHLKKELKTSRFSRISDDCRTYLYESLPHLISACEGIESQSYATPYQNNPEVRLVVGMAHEWERLTGLSAAQRDSYSDESGEVNYFVNALNSLVACLNEIKGGESKIQFFSIGRVRDILERSNLYESEFMKNLKK